MHIIAECASWKFASNRALCGHCRSVIWLSNLTYAAPHHCRRKGRDEVKLRPLLPDTVSCLTTMWFVPSRLAHCTYITALCNSNTDSCSLFESAVQFYPRNIITCLPFHWGCIQIHRTLLDPVLDQVAKYILHNDDLAASSSESDDTDDSDYENGHPRFWTF